MSVIAIYPGTFDPITYGHVDIIKRASNMFETLLIAVANNHNKKSLFSQEKRIEFISHSIDLDNVIVYPLDGLLIDFANQHGGSVIVRGLRNLSDFDYELQMAHVNRELSGQLETIFLPPSTHTGHISASLVREIASYGGDISHFVPNIVATTLEKQ